VNNHTNFNTYTPNWPEFYGDEPVSEPDDAHERFTEERDAWLNEEPGVACDACGGPVDGEDGATDDVIVLCGSFYGNGCADMEGAFDYA
jgi:hypothetical protein